jgi:hypothetical protein
MRSQASPPEGEVAGITYWVRGSGPPVVLMPLDLTPSQWEQLIEPPSARYCTIRPGGPRSVEPALKLLWEASTPDECHQRLHQVGTTVGPNLVMNKVHGLDLVGSGRRRAIVAQLRLDPALGRFVALAQI